MTDKFSEAFICWLFIDGKPGRFKINIVNLEITNSILGG